MWGHQRREGGRGGLTVPTPLCVKLSPRLWRASPSQREKCVHPGVWALVAQVCAVAAPPRAGGHHRSSHRAQTLASCPDSGQDSSQSPEDLGICELRALRSPRASGSRGAHALAQNPAGPVPCSSPSALAQTPSTSHHSSRWAHPTLRGLFAVHVGGLDLEGSALRLEPLTAPPRMSICSPGQRVKRVLFMCMFVTDPVRPRCSPAPLGCR